MQQELRTKTSELHRLGSKAVRILVRGKLALGVVGLFSVSLAFGDDSVTFKLATGSDSENSTERQMTRLLHQYDTSRWTFTHSVIIDEHAIPHSHPVLTLHTRHRKDDELLLSTYIHEQLHWFVGAHQVETDAAMRELRSIYPAIPVGYPKGSNDAIGNYEHLIVIYLEYRADRVLLGELKARQIMAFWGADHYTWLYREVLANPEVTGKIVRAHGLAPG